jgi:hypothetical protein
MHATPGKSRWRPDIDAKMVQVFISYARDDDYAPPDRDEAKGFVTYLDEQLRYELVGLGAPRPTLWRDKRHIDPGDEFDPKITAAIEASSLFLVVLSRNWVARPWCRRELELFRSRWPSNDETRRRIVVVSRNHVIPEETPNLLQGQEGYRFFELDPESEAGQEQHFFARGRVLDPRYETRIGDLARYLWRAAARIEMPSARLDPPQAAKPAALPVATRKLTVFISKPAADMRLAYDRLCKELSRAGYGVVPPPDETLPFDDSAERFVDQALASADLSVHLIGDKLGYAPEDLPPIVRLQLSRSAAQCASRDSFRRILWAPRVVAEADESGVSRDPLAVVAALGGQLDTDTVVGDNLSEFAQFLLQHLDRLASSKESLEPVEAGASVYIYHRPEDESFALNLAVALRERKLRTVLPAFEGNPAELDAFHRETLRECAAIVLCWANASEVWARATCRELRSWERLGRDAKFALRGLVAGPPPSSRKSMLVKLPPEDEIDVIVDLTALDAIPPEVLDPLVKITASGSV